MQVVARSLETALHKLHELKFDLAQVVAGFGTAPLTGKQCTELTRLLTAVRLDAGDFRPG